MFGYLLALGLGLAPSAPPESIRSVAAAIAAVTDDREDAVTLIVIDANLRSTTPRGFAFGLAWAARPRTSLQTMAETALSVIHVGRHHCGGQLELALGFFHTGACRVTHTASVEARTIRRVLSIGL
jgi:hypothetical protein